MTLQTKNGHSNGNGQHAASDTANEDLGPKRVYDENFVVTPAYKETLPDLQNGPASLIKGKPVTIQQVGIHNFRLPLRFRTRDGDPMALETSVTGSVSLDAHAKGINMSRIIRTFYEHGLTVRHKDGTGAAVPLQVEIIDDGPGIPADLTQDIFEPFVSGRENGTGLGLALISKIVSDHDGLISVESVPGRTAFRLSLPVAPKGGAA